MRGPMRTATVLFTDMVGSTELLARLGTAANDDVVARHFADLRSALAVHRGSEIKTLGDGIMATFGSAGDALACAVTMQRAVARQAAAGPSAAFGLRVGVSAGDAVDRGEDLFGLPVVEAARLCAAADAGQVLVADVVRSLAGGGSGMHRLAPLGALELKGLAEPLPTWSVDWGGDGDRALRVALAEDSALLRQTLAQALAQDGLDVVIEAGDAETLLRQLPAARPHVAVLDVRMPPTHTTEGLDAAERIRAEHPDVGVLVLSAAVEPGAARRLLDGPTEGIGYLLKERVADLDELGAAIRAVAGGGSAIDPEVVARLAAAPAGGAAQERR